MEFVDTDLDDGQTIAGVTVANPFVWDRLACETGSSSRSDLLWADRRPPPGRLA